jgi:hypothetical protein
MRIRWKKDRAFQSANQAETARVDGYELTAFDLPAGNGSPRIVGWELYGGRDLLDLLRKGESSDFAAAKLDAETAYRAVRSAVASTRKTLRHGGGAR